MGGARFSRVLALGAISLCLAACGGGGTSSTPAPSPSPTPTPGPTQTNANLLGPLVSESFTNDATSASGTFPGAASLVAGPSTLTISYNQSNNAYTIQTQGRTQTFSPGDKDASKSTAEQTTFKKTSGSTTDLLTLTNPGTSGRFLYKYVGAGFWQRSVQSSSSVAGSFDSFTYGVATPSSAVPTTGNASYDFDVIGVLAPASGAAPYGMGGNGTMTVDFAAGQLVGSGNVSLVDSLTGQTIEFGTAISLNGSITSSKTLSGSFVYDPNGSRYVGGLAGRFYGPAADEFGASVWGTAQNQAFPGALSAALIGRKGTSGPGSNLSLLSLSSDQTFYAKGAHILIYVDPATGKVINSSVQEVSQFTGAGSIGPQLDYKASTNTWTITDNYQGSNGTGSYGPSQQLASQSDARFTEYRSVSGANTSVFRLYKPGSGNPEVALTYASYGIWDQLQNPASDGLNHNFRTYFTYGIQSTAFPRSGTAAYSGLIAGQAGSTIRDSDPYDVTGNFAFTFDFGADNISGSFNPVLKNLSSGATTNLAYSLVNTRGPLAGGQGFDGYLLRSGADPSNVTGAFKGLFFGPATNEIAGTWVIREAEPNTVGQYFNMTGVFFGKKN